MLITSLALLARSRAWVVFRWVGVAAPAQRRFWGIAQRVTGGSPDRFRVGRRCRATVRAHAHLGSEHGLRWLREMAVPSPPRAPGSHLKGGFSRPGAPLSWHAIFFGNLRVTVDPVVGGSLEDAPALLLLWCI